MKFRKILLFLLVFLAVVYTLSVCKPPTPGPDNSTGITPVQLPSLVPGFKFPEDSTVIYGWMSNKNFPDNYDSASVYKHAWGVWAGLTASSGQVFQGDSLLVYETWLGIGDIQNLVIEDSLGCEGVKKSLRAGLDIPKQFEHGFQLEKRRSLLMEQGDSISNTVNFWVTVSYDPNAACFATKNKLLKESVINSYAVSGGIGNIPSFPNNAITIKPTYLVGEQKDNLIRIPVWTGPPPGGKIEAWGTDKWPRCVYADVQNKQTPNKKLVPAKKLDRNPDSIAAATCNLSDFINFNVDQEMANYMNQQDSIEGLSGKDRAVAGQIAILVAMHVTTKEISNWTWQSYYWAPDPETPDAPSSKLAASLRPSQLQGAASHYALTTAYTFVLPNQPLTGGTNTGVKPMLGYNPYLEAGFDPSAFQVPSVLLPGPQYGIQTNCMSCHGLATNQPSIGYTTDQYISMDTSWFNNKVKVDFAWSIADNLIPDSVTAAKKTAAAKK